MTRIIPIIVVCVCGPPVAALAQDQTALFRVTTELVQTDVMVFDKEGQFVSGLRPEDFELRIDGKVRPVRFFEQVAAGTADEASQLRSASGTTAPSTSKPPARVSPSVKRTIFFYVDDLHLDLAGLTAARNLIAGFINDEMSDDDEVAIASASGQIGFLQQLTDNKRVLRTALQRLELRPNSRRDLERPPMTEYQAVLIERYDRDVTAFFVQETIRQNPGITAAQADNLVRARSRALLQQAAQITMHTLAGLENLIRSASEVPGRKLVFLISGGFLLDDPEGRSNFRRLTSAAARTGTIVYSIDARGLTADVTEASNPRGAALMGALLRVPLGELSATQDGLVALARATGGRAILNTNATGAGLSQALVETSTYYLLAWEPDQHTQKASTFRTIEVKLTARPDLTVRVRRGFFDVEPPPPVSAKAKEPKPAEQTPEAQLQKVIGGVFPQSAFPISLSLNYLFTAERRLVLGASIQIPQEFLSFDMEDAKQRATLRIAGLVLNDRGQGVTFNKALQASRETASVEGAGQSVTYTHQIALGPGLYQVRVAVRDDKSGRTGSAHAWIEIPDLASRQLALSSLIVGDPKLLDLRSVSDEGQSGTASMSIDRRFARGSSMRFFVFAYNAARPTPETRPDVAVQVQILRGTEPVSTMPFRKMATEGADLDRLPYAADVSLADLPPGRYVLEVTVIDRIANTSISQRARFEVL